jgi:DNA-binding response OmpR family regulator
MLAVDDEADSLNLLRGILNSEGYEVRAVTSGPMALAPAAAHPPDMILLDLKVSGMDGLESCRRLKETESTRGIPLMLIGGASEIEQRIQGLAIGAIDFVTRPFRL